MPKTNTARIMPADPMTRASELLSDGSMKIHEGIAALAEALAVYDEHGEEPGAGWRELHDACSASKSGGGPMNIWKSEPIVGKTQGAVLIVTRASSVSVPSSVAWA